MDRINGAGHVGHMFVAEDVATNRPPTEITHEWLNTIQEELAAIVEFEGGALNSANNGQVLAKLQALFLRKSGGDLTGAITQKFSGLYWQGTPVGGAFVRKYADVAAAATVGGIEDCTVYNVAVDPATGVWAGRDVADICWLEKWSDVGGVKEFWYAPTAAAGVVPAWQKVDSLDLINAIRTLFGSLVVSGTISANAGIFNSINGGQLAGFRNRIINGQGKVAQRVAAALTNTLAYGQPDRMMAEVYQGTGISGNFVNTSGISGMSSGYAFGTVAGSWTAGQFIVQHRIESINTLDLNGQTITVSCRVYQNTGAARNFTIGIGKPTATADTFSTQVGLQTGAAQAVPSGVTTLISSTFTLGAADATLGLSVTISDNAANTVANKYYLIGDLQLEIGSVATPFEQRPISVELGLCQRYYEVLGGEVVSDIELATYNAASAACYITIPYKTQKRVSPTVSKLGTWTVSNCGQPFASVAGTKGCLFGFSATVLGSCYAGTTGSTTYITADSEL